MSQTLTAGSLVLEEANKAAPWPHRPPLLLCFQPLLFSAKSEKNTVLASYVKLYNDQKVTWAPEKWCDVNDLPVFAIQN